MSIEKITQIALPILAENGFELVRIKYLGSNQNVLQVMVEEEDGTMSAKNCAKVSRLLMPEIEDYLGDNASLEVSSPGIDRPLTRLKDYINWQGFEAKINLRSLIDGRKRLRGIILVDDETKENGEINVKPIGGDETFTVNFKQIEEAKLVFSDTLIKETSKRFNQ